MTADLTAKAWYRHPMMWLVIAPPLGAVIAGVITFILILQHPDPAIDTHHPTQPVIHGNAANSVIPPAE